MPTCGGSDRTADGSPVVAREARGQAGAPVGEWLVTPRLQRKMIEAGPLAQRVRELQGRGKTVVHCHGCFDLVHPGHVRYLQFARQLGDVLIVSLTGDSMVSKGPDRPYIPQELRAENLAALEFVDWVVIDPHPTACELLERLRPDVYVKGREYAASDDPRFLREKQIVEQHGGRVIYHSGDIVFSSTRLLQSLEHDAHLDELRLRALCRRHGIDLGTVRDALEAMVDLPLLVVGDVFRERYVFCDATGAAGDAPILSLQAIAESESWGGAAALALQAAALGARPLLLTCAPAEAIDAAKLEAQGVRVRALPRGEPLPLRTTFLADDSKLMRVHEGAGCPLDSADERRMLDALRETVRGCRAVVFVDHGYGILTPDALRDAVPLAQAAGAVASGASGGTRGELGPLRRLDLLTTTERRLREARHDMTSGLPAVAWGLMSDTHCRNVLVSLHKRGILGFATPEAAGHAGQPDASLGRLCSDFVPSFSRHVADLAGTDEAVLTVATLTLATGRSLPMATYLASAAESLTASRAGRSRVKRNELRSWIETRAELRGENRFLPDAATTSDIAGIAPPLAAAPPQHETAHA